MASPARLPSPHRRESRSQVRRDIPAAQEELLLRQAAEGQTAAFTALVERHRGAVFRHALRMLQDSAEAEDVTQEILLAMHGALRDFRREARLSTWLYQVTRNRCLNRLQFLERRGWGRHRPWVDDVREMSPRHRRCLHDEMTAVLRRLERDEVRDLLGEAMSRLPDEQQQLLLLREVEELSYEEIARCTGLALGTVKSRLHRARAALCGRLLPHSARLLEFLLAPSQGASFA
ncbi:MAG: RNA polymerase sigma factor [Myxococcota bacterium]